MHTNRNATSKSLFERYLTLWVALSILVGLVLGNLTPEVFGVLAGLEYASVNLVVAVLIWAMVYPMMIAIDFGSLREVGRAPNWLVITLVISWLINPSPWPHWRWCSSTTCLPVGSILPKHRSISRA